MPDDSYAQFCKSMKAGYMLGSFCKKARTTRRTLDIFRKENPGDPSEFRQALPLHPEDLRRPRDYYESSHDIVPISLHIYIPPDTGGSVGAGRLRGSSCLLKISYGIRSNISCHDIYVTLSDRTSRWLGWPTVPSVHAAPPYGEAPMFHSFKRMLSPCPPGRPGLLLAAGVW